MRLRALFLCAASFVATLATIPAAPISRPLVQDDELMVRIVDVGAGLCTITSAPGSDGRRHYMVFDAGEEFPFSSNRCLEAVREVVEGNAIDLMVISHPDADHVVNAAGILAEFEVQQIVRTGHERDRAFWFTFDNAVTAEADAGATVINLRDAPLVPGTQIPLGDATLTLAAGWHDWPAPESFDSGEARNVISIVGRLDFAGRSVLFTGDTIGRRKSDADTACKNAEEFMVANAGVVPIRSNVVIAPHHGGNNGSSACFVEAVFGTAANRMVPRFVVFSAGHNHDHPTVDAVDRYRDSGEIAESFIFRTDRGDSGEGQFHWDDPGATSINCVDDPGDDDIDIRVNAGGFLELSYVTEDGGCANDQ